MKTTSRREKIGGFEILLLRKRGGAVRLSSRFAGLQKYRRSLRAKIHCPDRLLGRGENLLSVAACYSAKVFDFSCIPLGRQT